MKSLHFIIAVLLIPLSATLTTPVFASASQSALSVLQTLDYRYFVAGGTCAAISHGITTPIDVIKTKKQSDPAKYGKMGLIGTAVDIAKNEGPHTLLGGLGPTVVGYGIEGAMKFGVYEIAKPIFRSLLSAGSDATGGNPALAYLCASVVAGAVAAVLLCPMESTRIRIVTDPAYANKGLFTALPKMIREEGPWASFALGLWAMLAKQVPYTLGKQVSFDVFAGMLYAFYNSLPSNILPESQIKWVVSVVAAFLASIIACISSQPGDMILTETYKKPAKGSSSSDRSFIDVMRAIYGAGGWSSFFTGTGARIVHVGLIITSQLVIYDIVKQLLGLPATGSH
jgi:solute carrier family 25 (mitochondrial phosphate transporter), member 3